MKLIYTRFLALIVTIIFSPAICFFALIIYLYDRHKPFYTASRVGKDGKLFSMIKLRSMVIDAHKYKIDSTAADDPRITPVGRIIRKFKLDELTQVVNVLKGDINFVGPRPQVLSEVNRYTPEEKKTLSVKPGITDISSIVFADEGDILSGSENPDLLYAQIERPWKSRLALLYIEHASFWLDLKIMFFTFTNIFARKWTLRQLSKIVAKWQNDVEDLPKIVARTKDLYAYSVPGMTEVITEL